VVDPGTAIAIGQVVLDGVRDRWSRNRNEVTHFFRELPGLIADDRHLPWKERKQIAEAAGFLGSRRVAVGRPPIRTASDQNELRSRRTGISLTATRSPVL